MNRKAAKERKQLKTFRYGQSRYKHWDEASREQQKAMMSIQRKRTWHIRQILLTEETYECKICGRVLPKAEMTLDHIIPISRGGKTVFKNVQIVCIKCNQTKGDFDVMKEKWND